MPEPAGGGGPDSAAAILQIGFVFATPQEAAPLRTRLRAMGYRPYPGLHPTAVAPVKCWRPGADRYFSWRTGAARFWSWRRGECIVHLAVAGMGAGPARSAAETLCALTALDWLVSAGVSGGLSPQVADADLVVAKQVVSTTGRVWQTATLPGLDEHDLLQSAAAVGIGAPQNSIGRVFTGTVFCAPGVVSSAEEKRQLGLQTGALAVDLESGPVAQVAQEAGALFACVRGISDGVDDNLPLRFDPFIRADGSLNLTALVFHVLLHPRTIPGLLALGKRTAAAATRLAALLCNALTRCTGAPDERARRPRPFHQS